MRMLLGIAGLVLLSSLCVASSTEKIDAGLPKGLPRSVTGHGETVDNAKKAALSKAIEEVTGLMRQSERTSFVVTEDYLRQHVVDGGRAGKDIQLDNIREPFKGWVMNYRTDNEWWKDIARRDQEAERKLRAEDRQKVGSVVVLGLAFLLLVGFGYLRLDEYTQRRYTTWLRVAGVGVATTALAGWWWIFIQAPG